MDKNKIIKYTSNHEWISVDSDDVFVGITDHAQSQLGDIVYVDVDTVGEKKDASEVFGTIEAVKTVSDLFCPVSGEILEFNEKLKDNPELINKDPNGKGWIIKIKLSDAKELDNLMDYDEYNKTL